MTPGREPEEENASSEIGVAADDLAFEILQAMGGKENISALTLVFRDLVYP